MPRLSAVGISGLQAGEDVKCAYMEYSTWHGMSVYRRTVGYDSVVWC